MRNIYLIAGLLLSLATCLPAQKQANHWHFGENYSLDFSSGAPAQASGSQLVSFEGCASVSDAQGNLLFYTNGGGREPIFGQDAGHIWDRNHGIMYDMMGVEGGGWSSAQSAVIFEVPGEDSVYYVFTMDEIEHYVGASNPILAAQPLGRGLRYFTVDMRLNGGLGAVVLADQPVIQPAFEALCAIPHQNGSDYWILINQDTANNDPSITVNLGIYLVTASGVTAQGIYPNAFAGVIKASPDGRSVATDNLLLDFDPATGNLSLRDTFTTPNRYHEFSPNSRYLYAVRGNFQQSQEIYRYDLQAANVNASATLLQTLTDPSPSGQLQLAPDGKIYFSQYDFNTSSTMMHRILCPNTANATVEENVFPFGSFGLPNFPAWIFQNDDAVFVALGPDTLNLALLGGSLNLDAGNPGASYLWSTGATTQAISVTQAGVYTVTVTGTCGTGVDSIVVINEPLVGLARPIATPPYLLSPQPAQDKVNVTLHDLSLLDAEYAVVDVLGRRLISGRITDLRTQIDLTPLAPGRYVLKVGNQRGQALQIYKD